MLALFDFLVAVVAGFALFKARRRDARDVLAALGYVLIALAALLGTLRFTFFPQLAPAHQFVSQCASIYGIPAIAVGFFLTAEERLEQWLSLAVGVALTGLSILFFSNKVVTLAMGIAAQCVWLFSAFRFHRVFPKLPAPIIASVVCVSVAGLLFNKPGATFGMQNLNIFHGLLALGLMQQALAWGFLPKQRQRF